ncbi:hypothetical protein [Bradyrhizobium sp. RP6]|uniref:hypothetical protein n=1 Tax=Bradyrhizobium sp. RP6 TaxID=2489596 RepID=UPI000F540FC4|nr:hypothetical protein [Bradyrhizobium sp. RP6]RQH15987.1 hypothetical protein EHH60_02010 [Bradyrhizobium sp. RP6]
MIILPFISRIRVGGLEPPSVPGSQNWGAGSRSVVIPVYKTLTMQIWGAGGGGGNMLDTDTSTGANEEWGGTGGQSYFAAPGVTLIANGGTGGGNGNFNLQQNGASGSPGTASGGTTNTTGGGNAGGAGAGPVAGYYGGNGGRGGFVSRTWNWFDPGAPVAGSSYTLVTGGGGGPSRFYVYQPQATGGANASATMSWT